MQALVLLYRPSALDAYDVTIDAERRKIRFQMPLDSSLVQPTRVIARLDIFLQRCHDAISVQSATTRACSAVHSLCLRMQ